MSKIKTAVLGLVAATAIAAAPLASASARDFGGWHVGPSWGHTTAFHGGWGGFHGYGWHAAYAHPGWGWRGGYGYGGWGWRRDVGFGVVGAAVGAAAALATAPFALATDMTAPVYAAPTQVVYSYPAPAYAAPAPAYYGY